MYTPIKMFKPVASDGNGVLAGNLKLAVTTAVASVAVDKIPSGGGTMKIHVVGTANIAWCYNAGTNLTIDNGVYMPAGSDGFFQIPENVTEISAVADGAGSTLRITIGDGEE